MFDDYVDLTNSIANAGLAFSGLFPKEWARIAGTASVTVVGKTLTSVAFFCTAYTASLAAAEHGMFAEHDLCALETARYFIALAGGVTWLGVLILGLAGGGPVAWAVFAAPDGGGHPPFFPWKKANSARTTLSARSCAKSKRAPLALEGHQQTFEVPNRLPGGGVFADGLPSFRYPAYDLKLYYHLSFPRLFDHDIVMSSRWDELKKNLGPALSRPVSPKDRTPAQPSGMARGRPGGPSLRRHFAPPLRPACPKILFQPQGSLGG